MSEQNTNTTVQEIETYLHSQEDTKAKKELLDLFEKCKRIPNKIERLKIAKYMAYRAYVNKAEKILSKAIKRVSNDYNDIVDKIFDKTKKLEQFKDIEEIDFSEYKPSLDELEKAKEKYQEEYTEEEKKALIQKELYIIEKSKIFNTMPIPHEILKNADREIQSKMKKFNDARQKRTRIINTMQQDYEKLIEPREESEMIDQALSNMEKLKYVLTNSEYKALEKSYIKRKKKIYRNTKEIRDIIKSKEKKTGIINYNLQEARYERMSKLGETISSATKIIEQNKVSEVEKQLEKLKASYEREKQFASVIKKLHEEEQEPDMNLEVSTLETEIHNLEETINVSKQTVQEQEEIINNAKKELLILWKIEINTTISKQEKILELQEDNRKNNQEKKEKESILKKLKKLQGKEEYILRM